MPTNNTSPSTLQLQRPHKAQSKVLSERKRFNVLCCGRRWGKSTLGIHILLPHVLKGFPVAWFAPTYKLLSAAYDEILQLLAPLNPSANKTEGSIEIPHSKGVIDFWTLNDRSAGRGRKYKAVIIDEAADCATLADVWAFSILPTLADYQGEAWFLGTPKGQNYFKLLYDRGQDFQQKEWKSWRMPTSSNPFILREEIEALKAEQPARAHAQEFEAEFLENEGAVFNNLENCLKAKGHNAPIPDHKYVFGVDWAKENDFTVVTILDTTTMELAAIDRMNKVSYTSQSKKLVMWYEHWKPSMILAERNSIGEPLLESLYRQGLPIEGFYTSHQSKVNLIEDLVLAFEQEKIQIFDYRPLIAELQAYECRVSSSGNTIYNAPEGSHDDCVISLALAYHAAKPVKKKRTLSESLAAFDRQQMRV